tara:strand:+ start:406 stop:618 length:213 start_codon:yes stop_codon:yes gene_type:complete
MLNPNVSATRAPKVLSDERTRRDYDEGSDVVLQGRDEAGGLREQVGLERQPSSLGTIGCSSVRPGRNPTR